MGHEEALNPAFADSSPQQAAITEGSFLLGALTAGKSWLTDVNKLESLLAITTGARLRQMLEGRLSTWNNTPLTIAMFDYPGSPPMQARVAQYELHSMEALQDKLAQFPAGTTFALQLSAPDSPAGRLSEASLRTFLSDHGMIVATANE